MIKRKTSGLINKKWKRKGILGSKKQDERGRKGMPLELASITKAHYKLKHKNSNLEGNSDNRKKCIQKPFHATSLLL